MVPDLKVEIPDLILGTATDGQTTVVIHPSQVGDFVYKHRFFSWVGFHWAFDFWVVQKYLEAAESDDGGITHEGLWWVMADDGQLHDLMYLDMLVRLAKDKGGDDVRFQPRNLGEVAWDYARYKADKQSPYRTRFGELAGQNWSSVDPGFFDYAAGDAVATLRAWEVAERRARRLIQDSPLRPGRDYFQGAEQSFGLLTEGVQTKASIALAGLTRRGIAVDLNQVATVQARLENQVGQEVLALASQYPTLFKTYRAKDRAGQYRLTASGVPSIDQKVLQGILLAQPGVKGVPLTTRGVSTSIPVWRDLAPDSDFVQSWGRLQDAAKLLQFVRKLDRPEIHPGYRTLVRTGRTSASGPNIQQMPREEWFRKLFVARDGYFLAAVDYSFIELRTLAAHCRVKFGKSVLADVIEAGRDPHAYTAAMLEGMGFEEFLALKKGDPARFKTARQAAKAVNFGVPGGLGVEKLIAYAKANYQVIFTPEQAQQFRTKLTEEVYPELWTYLHGGEWDVLAYNLGAPEEKVKSLVREVMGSDSSDWVLSAVNRLLIGVTDRPNGQPYTPWTVGKVWAILRALAPLHPDLMVRHRMGKGRADKRLAGLLFNQPAVTLTGRLRAGAKFTESRNTPFQGLAADGAKLALWRLVREGYRVVAFVHDEVVVEVTGEAQAQRVYRIMCEEMGVAVGGLIPIEAEFKVAREWSKP